ncbi:MAG TPA: baseplate J/gp47 family protein [Candidatus Binataceae bacterium]|nr:baseplate J/gp47 family protein [Candidatus Binataceae bacterium]
MGAGIPGLPPPQFVNDADGLDPNLILADMIAAFEAAAGRTLQPAQVERLLINLYAYRESLVRDAIQYAAQQNLLAFASFPMIDYLGGLLGVTRLGMVGASTMLQFTLVNPLNVQYTIAAATAVGTSDGLWSFATDSDLIITPGLTQATVSATATVGGPGSNGYLPGQINVQLNPSAQIQSVANTTVSAGGSAPETDDHYRIRIQAAPNEFSVAGPAAAYRFFALSADPTITDVQIVSPVPGTVDVYVLTGPITLQPAAAPNPAGVAGAALLQKVQAILSADEVRPLTDTVNVYPAIEVDYQIAATVTIYSDVDPTATMAAANAAAVQFAVNQADRIGRDIVVSQIVSALSVPGVYEVTVTAPAAGQGVLSISSGPGQWANCTAISLSQAIATEHS